MAVGDVTREDLKAAWKEQAAVARRLYLRRAEHFAVIASEYMGGEEHPDPDAAVAILKAHAREANALEEYLRVVGVFNDLVLRGILPRETP